MFKLRLEKNVVSIFLLAALLGVFIIPFLYHPDLKTQYFHYEFLNSGVVNIYQFLDQNRKGLAYTDTFNYPPDSYFLLGSWYSLIHNFLDGSIHNWLMDWSNGGFSADGIYKFMFWLKLPYLAFNLLAGFLLYRLSDKKIALWVVAAWFFNPVTLYTIYGLGNFDAIPMFCSVLGYLCFMRKKWFLSGLFLGLGIGLKMYPLFMLPILGIYLLKERNFKALISLSVGAVIFAAIPAVFFIREMMVLSGQNLVNLIFEWKLFWIDGVGVSGFALLYGVLIVAYIFWGKDRMLYYLVLAVFSMFVMSRFHGQWVLWMWPFVILLASKSKLVMIASIIFCLGLFIYLITFQDKFLTVGIISPVMPELYNVDSFEKVILGRFNIQGFSLISRVMFWVSFLLIFLASFWNEKNTERWYKKYVLIMVGLMFAAIVGWIVGGVWLNSRMEMVGVNLAEVARVDLNSDKPLSFKIDSSKNGLNLMEIKMFNQAIKNNGPLEMKVANSKGDSVGDVKLSGSNIGDGDFVRFRLPPLTGGEYTVFFDSKGNTDNPKLQLAVDKAGTPIYRMYAKVSLGDSFKTVLTGFTNRFWKDSGFAWFWVSFVTILGIVTFVVYCSKKKISD